MLGYESCPGCKYSGHSHLESCTEAAHNKYREPMNDPKQPTEVASVIVTEWWKKLDDITHQLVARQIGSLPKEHIVDGPKIAVMPGQNWGIRTK